MMPWFYVAALGLLLAGAAPPTEPKWVTSHSTEAGFSIDVPCDCPTGAMGPSPRLNTPLGLHPARDALTCSCSSGLVPGRAADMHGASISVIYADLPKTLLEKFTEEELLATALFSPGLSQSRHVVSWERKHDCGDYPGRENEYRREAPGSDLRVWQRACLVEDRMYKLGVAGHQKDAGYVQRFFDSFRLRPEPN